MIGDLCIAERQPGWGEALLRIRRFRRRPRHRPRNGTIRSISLSPLAPDSLLALVFERLDAIFDNLQGAFGTSPTRHLEFPAVKLVVGDEEFLELIQH